VQTSEKKMLLSHEEDQYCTRAQHGTDISKSPFSGLSAARRNRAQICTIFACDSGEEAYQPRPSGSDKCSFLTAAWLRFVERPDLEFGRLLHLVDKELQRKTRGVQALNIDGRLVFNQKIFLGRVPRSNG